ncbi:BON domain-containing protein [Leptothrix discophora]|uniref:BON domain-containing protein n=1 Tax=Leptothrix discophora TaxID=89 RepID=A0ABT9G1C9_LEPDI|nr:BON domain-containing protein [Leptothrix discophora]MDP4299988.1 BON domain-containing protein [Leptothrix discophora]
MNTRFQRVAAAAALLTSLVATGAAQAGGVVGNTDADRALANKVQAAVLAAAPFQDAQTDLTITADQGRVQISGWVSHADDVAPASQIARQVDGVQSVSTRLRAWSTEPDYRVGLADPELYSAPTAAGPMSTGIPSDDALAAKVRQALIQSGAFEQKNTELMVRASDGRVSLSGWLASAADEQAVYQAARQVAGVTQVQTSFRSWASE